MPLCHPKLWDKAYHQKQRSQAFKYRRIADNLAHQTHCPANLQSIDAFLDQIPLFEPNQILASVFGAVTPRTAGFNTIDTGAYTEGTRMLTVMLMFIGGSTIKAITTRFISMSSS